MRRRANVLAILMLASLGCNGLSLKKADDGATGDILRSALRLQNPSTAATTYLHAKGLDSRAWFDPNAVSTKLGDESSPEGRLVLAEVCDLAGREAEFWSPGHASEHYLDAAYHSSRALFDGGESLSNDRRRDAERIYNHALARFLRKTAGRKLRPDADWEERLCKAGVGVLVRRDEAVWNPEAFDEFRFASDYVALGVPSRKKEGLGVSLFAVKSRRWRDPERQNPPDKFFPSLQVYPATAFLRFPPHSGPGRPAGMLELHDPLRHDFVAVGQHSVKLVSDTTTPLVYQVTQSDLEKFTYIGMFNPAGAEHKTGLFMSHPYERGKIPVVLVHGLWSSPATWTRAINDLRADPEIRERYQFWVYQYPTGNPFIHSAALLRQRIAEMRTAFDPDRTDPAFDQMVVVGHSMGGLISKTLIASSGDAVWRLVSNRPFADLKASSSEREAFAQVFFFEPVPEVKRVVYVAVPHRGSQIGSNWLGQIGDYLIRRPRQLLSARDDVLKQNGDAFFNESFVEGIPSSVKTLRPGSPMLEIAEKLPANPVVPRHSIIARVVPVAASLSTDGVVPYESSHLDGVASEKLVTGSHTCLDETETIDELRRILLLHVGAGPR